MIVGAYEAKTHLPKLLERVARGERIVIAKHGVPIAELTPVRTLSIQERCQTIARLKALRQTKRLGESLRAMIEEGRR